MIQASFDLQGLEMNMEGHAGAKEEGQEYDLVCCAASTVSQALLYNIEEWNEEHRDPLEIEYQMEKGKIRLMIKAPEWAKISIQRMMQYALRGMQMLEDRYHNYIRVTEA